MEILSAARRTRLHRTSGAQFLATLESSCSKEELVQLDWAALDQVPHWCFSENAARNRLQLVCGCVFLAPLIVKWIDGSKLKQARTLVGPAYFDAAMHVGAGGSLPAELGTKEEVPELLASAGAAVLVYAVEQPVIRTVLSRQFPMALETIDGNIARSVYKLSLDVIDRVESQLPNNTRQSPGETTGSGAAVENEVG